MIRAQGARGPGFGSRNGPCCSIAKAPRALNPTMAPCRPNTLNSMIGCDVTVIYDANGLKFDALNIVDPATGFQILAVLDGPRCWRAPALSWAQTEPLLQSCCISGVRFIPWLGCLGSMTVWPSGLRRWAAAPPLSGCQYRWPGLRRAQQPDVWILTKPG